MLKVRPNRGHSVLPTTPNDPTPLVPGPTVTDELNVLS